MYRNVRSRYWTYQQRFGSISGNTPFSRPIPIHLNNADESPLDSTAKRQTSPPAIIQVCRLLRNEGLPMFYELNAFVYHQRAGFYPPRFGVMWWLESLDPAIIKCFNNRLFFAAPSHYDEFGHSNKTHRCVLPLEYAGMAGAWLGPGAKKAVIEEWTREPLRESRLPRFLSPDFVRRKCERRGEDIWCMSECD